MTLSPPSLRAPAINVDFAESELMMLSMVRTAESIDGYKQDVQDIAQRQQQASNERLRLMREAVDQQARLERQHKAAWVVSLIGKIAAVALSATLITCTAGIGIALGAVVTAYACVDLALDIADKISTNRGGPGVSLDKLVTSLVHKALSACGVSEETCKKVEGWVSMAAQMLISLAIGGCGLVAAYKGGRSVVLTLFREGTTCVEAGSDMGSSALQVMSVTDEKHLTDNISDQGVRQIDIERLHLALSEIVEKMNALIESTSAKVDAYSEINRDNHRVAMQLAA